MLKQVCCCFHNLGEEIKPLSAETSGAKPNHSTDTLPAGFPFPRGGGHDGKFGVEVHSELPCVPARQPPATYASDSLGSGQSNAAEREGAVVSCSGYVW